MCTQLFTTHVFLSILVLRVTVLRVRNCSGSTPGPMKSCDIVKDQHLSPTDNGTVSHGKAWPTTSRSRALGMAYVLVLSLFLLPNLYELLTAGADGSRI